MRALLLAAALCATPALAAPAFSPAETAAIYKGAGFKMKGKAVVDCAAADPSWPRSSIVVEPVDLNGDGTPEAFVTEGNIACYGRDEQGFTIVAKNPDGSWRKLGGSTGVPSAMKTRTKGWADVQKGGPGFARMPVMRWTGAAYTDPR